MRAGKRPAWMRAMTARSRRAERAEGPPCSAGDNAILVRDRRLGIRRVSRVLLDAADEIERSVKRLVVLRIRRDIGLRAGLLVTFGPVMAAQRGLAALCCGRVDLLRHLSLR